MPATKTRRCTVWGTDHDAETDTCQRPDDSISLTHSPQDGTYINVRIPANGRLTVDAAQELAAAILQDVSYARFSQTAADLRGTAWTS